MIDAELNLAAQVFAAYIALSDESEFCQDHLEHLHDDIENDKLGQCKKASLTPSLQLHGVLLIQFHFP
jgi:hypothetical protein